MPDFSFGANRSQITQAFASVVTNCPRSTYLSAQEI
jgi:hypothetical protein